MNIKWKIIYYQTAQSKSPVFDFIESLSATAQAKVANTFDLLEEFGIRLGRPHIKKLTGTQLWELRILGGDSIRIFYVTQSQQNFLLLHGFIKKKQKTEKKEIKIAAERLKDHISRSH